MNNRATRSAALKDLDGLGILEVLNQDSRPTFIIDLDPDLDLAASTSALTPCFGNASLRIHERLWDLVHGESSPDESTPSDTEYESFRRWVTSRTEFDESGDVFPSTHVFVDMLWTGSTVRKRWRFISGNRYQHPPIEDLSGATSADIITDSNAQDLPNIREKRRRMHSDTPKQRKSSGDPPNKTDDPSELSSATPSRRPAAARTNTTVGPGMSSYSSVGVKSTASLRLDTDHQATDWTVAHPKGNLTSHVQFARSVDWASTPLGDMSTWTPEFRQLANVIMKHPHPAALFWGSELVALYNEAYMTYCAGRKHPTLMGSPFQSGFPETWDTISDIFAACAQTGIPIDMKNQHIPMERYGFLEETYFTWSFTPLYAGGSKAIGFFNTPFETTHEVINNRRTTTLRRLGEEVALTRTMSDFWQAVLRGLEDNHLDVPMAILYSVVDGDEETLSTHSGSAISSKICVLEGTLGVPEVHPATPQRLDLKRNTRGVSSTIST